MLAMWKRGSFPFSVSGKYTGEGKLNFVELSGADSMKEQAPITFKTGRIGILKERFSYFGILNGRECLFRIDTGSDVSIVNQRFIDLKENSLALGNCKLKYPSGEIVPIKSRFLVKLSLGKFLMEMPMYVMEMEEDCLLGDDFLSKTGLSEFFDTLFGSQRQFPLQLTCSRMEKISKQIPFFLEEVFSKCAKKLDSSFQKEDFFLFLTDFQDVFSENIVAGNCDVVKHCIDLSDSRPIKQIPRRIPQVMRGEVEKIIEEMKLQGVIEESHSPWVSPAVMVKKKDGSIRFCVDYRKLNAVTKKDSFPLPRIDDILDQFSGYLWFTTLDLKSGYWQIKISPEDKEKTAFSIGSGLWQFTVMPFGLCNAPATFERLMEKVLKNLISKICFVYLDDVIVFGKSFEEMISNLREVFLRLREANLKINPKKCTFLSKEVKYLGHVISADGVATDSEKISSIKEWPVPSNKKQVRSFLGICSYYQRFVKGFSILAKPLYSLTENSTKFSWDNNCQTAFEKLKQLLVSSPILSFPIEGGDFILDTDASNHGIGAVLSQKQDGVEKVIAYFSRVLSKTERNYCVTRRELLAVVDSIKSFHQYLYGRKFLVRSDHVSLRWLMSFKELEGQLARWLERLQQYDFEVLHRKGVAHKNADSLSRRPCAENKCNYCSKVELKENRDSFDLVRRIVFEENDFKKFREQQLNDQAIAVILQGKEVGRRPSLQEISLLEVSAKIYWTLWDALIIKNGVLYRKWIAPNLKTEVLQIVVPRNRINQILEEAHDSPVGGHFGVNKTLEKIRKRFYWATCKSDVENWCRTCKICVAKKGPPNQGKSPLQIYNVGAPFERIQMDILGPLPLTFSGNRFLLVIVDCFSKWPEVIPLKNKRASSVARAFVEQVVSRHGVPLEVHTDQGRNFESKLFKEIVFLLGIKKTRTTPLHPQSDGQVERQYLTILNYLAKFISENQKDWDRWISLFLLSYRSSKHEVTGFSPAEIYLGRDLLLPLDLLRGRPPREEEEILEESSRNLKEKLYKIHALARQRIKDRAEAVKCRYDRRARNIQFEEGQKVWLYNPQRKLEKAPKLQSHWEGPYVIVKKLSDVVFCIRKSSKHRNRIVHSDRLASFYERN